MTTFFERNVKLRIDPLQVIIEGAKCVTIVEWTLMLPNGIKDLLEAVNPKYKYDIVISGTSTGVTVCHPDDVFSEETGRKISLAKAESKAYNAARRLLLKELMKVYSLINATTKEAVRFDFKTSSVIEHNEGYIRRISE